MQGGPGVFRGDLYFYRTDGDFRDRVGEIDTARCPLYLLTGEYDFSCTPDDTRATAEKIPGRALHRDEGDRPLPDERESGAVPEVPGAGAGRDPHSQALIRAVLSRRAFYTARTALWIICGWIGAAVLVHWVVRRVPTHLARELTAVATGAVMGLGSAWFELRVAPRMMRALTMGGFLLVRTFFYVTLCAVVIHAVTMSLLGLSEHGGLLAYYRSAQYRDFVLGGRFAAALAILTVVSFFINFVRQLNRLLGPGTLVSLLVGRYHRPVAEDRIFMFLDLNDSTAIAAELGPLRFNDRGGGR